MKNAGLMFVGAGAALLAGLFVVFKPETSPAPAVATDPVAGSSGPGAPAAVPDPAPSTHEFALTVAKGQLVTGPDTLRVRQGDTVVIRIDADAPDDVHLHGYDLHAHVKPGSTAEIRFVADRSGRFEYELHKAHADLGALEVHPR